MVVVILVDEVLGRMGFYKTLKNRGYEIAIIGTGKYSDLADYIIDADPKNLDMVVSELTTFMQKHEIACIFTASEFGIEIAAAASEILDIPYNTSFKAIKRARNKYLTRSLLSKNEIPTPQFFIAESEGEIIDKLKEFKFPVILKPLNAAGSCSVTKINSLAEAREKMQLAIKNRDRMPVNMHRKDTTHDYWLVEEFLEGFEISVESITYNSKTEVICIHDKFCTIDEPYFIEKIFVTPSIRIDIKLENEIVNMTKAILSALEFDFGVSHVEYKITSDGPRLLEVNGRVGGAMVVESVWRSTGINLYEVLLDIRTGHEFHVDIDKIRREKVAFSMIPVEEGVVEEIKGFDLVNKSKHIVYAEPWVEIGERIRARQANYGGFIFATGGDIENMLAEINKEEKKIEFVIKKEENNDSEEICID